MGHPVALLVILFLLIEITVPSSSIPTYREDSGVCTTPVCQRTAQYLLESMDFTVEPCQNFYQYCCGEWIRKHPIPGEKFRYSTFDVLYNEVLDATVESLQNASHENHITAVHDAAEYFAGCIDKDAREAAGLEPLRNLLNYFGGWPLITPGWNADGYEWQTVVATLTRTMDVKPVIAVHVDADANHTSQHILYIDQPNFGIGRNELVDTNSSERNQEIVEAYKTYMIDSAKLLNPSADKNQLSLEADEVIQFESNLAKFSKKPEDRRNPSLWYNKMSVAEVQRITENTNFLWTNFLNEVVADFPGVTSGTEVILFEMDYPREALKLISNTKKRTLANYIMWNLVKDVGALTTKSFRDIKFAFDKVELGVQKEEKLERICCQQTIDNLGHAVGRLYIDKFFTEQNKHEVTDLVEKILSAYKNSITSAAWMDDDTKRKAKDKVDAMINKMGYPQWIKNDNELNEYYRSVQNQIRTDQFFSSYLKVVKAVTAITLKKWNQPTNRVRDWGTTPAVVNAFYNPNANSITFPAAILRPPFFISRSIPAMNFGAIGTVIGHEVSHGFDDEGSQFDKEGNLVNWWSKETRDKFDEKANCFRLQYSGYVEPTTNMSLNGNNTLGENIADNGAVRNAFLAYKEMARSENPNTMLNKRLPGVQATPDQLFFIGFSSMWCGSERKESMQWSIQYDPHSLNEYRGLVPLSNSIEFARAFDCPIGSPMNTENKCILW